MRKKKLKKYKKRKVNKRKPRHTRKVKRKMKRKVKRKKLSKKDFEKIREKVARDDDTLKKIYGDDIPTTSNWSDFKYFLKLIKKPTNCDDCIKKFKKIFVSHGYRKSLGRSCKRYFHVGMYKPKK